MILCSFLATVLFILQSLLGQYKPIPSSHSVIANTSPSLNTSSIKKQLLVIKKAWDYLIPHFSRRSRVHNHNKVLVEQSHDFGYVPVASRVWHEFKIENRSDKPLRIRRVLPLCGCFKVETGYDSLIPVNGKRSFKVLLNTTGFHGRLTKYLYLDTEKDRILITVSATIKSVPGLKVGSLIKARYLIIDLPDGNGKVINDGGHQVYLSKGRLYVDLRFGSGQVSLISGGKKMTLPVANFCRRQGKTPNKPGWHWFAFK